MTNASEKILKPTASELGKPQHVLERLEQWAEDNPAATEYVVGTEFEAASILVAMAATLKVAKAAIMESTGASEETLNRYARRYRQAAGTGTALRYLREIDGDEENQIELFGKRIRAMPIYPH